MSKQAKLVLWEQRIAAWRGSGLSKRAWCRREGISAQTLGYWCRRSSSCGAMLPVVVSAAVVAAPAAAAVEVVLGNGVSLRLPSWLPSEELVHWLQALRAC